MPNLHDNDSDYTPSLAPMEEKVGGLSARDRIGKVGLLGLCFGIVGVCVSGFLVLNMPWGMMWLGGVFVGISLVNVGAGTILSVHSLREKQPEGNLVIFSNLLILGTALLAVILGPFSMRWDNAPNFGHLVIAAFVINVIVGIFRGRLWKWDRLRAWLDPTAPPMRIEQPGVP